MHKLRGYLVLFLLLLAGTVSAQEDTAGAEQSWMSMPVVVDSPTVDTSTFIPVQIDSARIADSIKKYGGVDEKEFIKKEIKNLCSPGMNGRGYVGSGSDSAAKYILKRFKEFNLKPVAPNGPYAQGFAFPVNLFPGNMEVFINDDSLFPGRAFVVDPASAPFAMDSAAGKLKVKKVKLGKVADTAGWSLKLAGFDSSHAYLLQGIEDVAKNLHMRKSRVLAMLPKGLYIIPREGNMTWSTRREQMAATVIYAQEDSLPRKVKNIHARIDAAFNPHQRSENVIACVPGEIKDSFIVFTAHYDHLGVMGRKTVFQGASDNASGVAMLLYLANYFSRHPQKYSILFIAFGAEEASLMGSEFYAWHSFVPIKNIKFLTNIDIMGDATNGITVVNAVTNVGQFVRMQEINDKEKYLRTLMPRENAANSDHYYFAKQHVPCFFIYSNGGTGHNHDIYDVKTSLSLNHVREVSRLLIDFVAEWKDIPMEEAPGAGRSNAEPTAPPAEETPAANPETPTTPPQEEGPSSVPDENPEKTPEK